MRFKTMSNKTIMVALGAMLALSVGVFIDRAQKEIEVSAATYFESFDQRKGSSTYTTEQTYTSDDNGFPWELRGRGDATLNGNAWMLGKAADGSYARVTAQGGISSFSLLAVRAFTNTHPRTLQLNVNGVSKGTFSVSTSSNTAQEWTVNNINVTGEVNIEVISINTGTRGSTTIDDFTWADYSPNGSVDVDGVELNKSETTIETGATEQLTATVSPGNATDKTVSWSTSAAGVATVSGTGLVTAVSVGQATITVKTNDGDFEDDCVVTVQGGPRYISSSITFTLRPGVAGNIADNHERQTHTYSGLEWTTNLISGSSKVYVSATGQLGSNANWLDHASMRSELYSPSDGISVGVTKVLVDMRGSAGASDGTISATVGGTNIGTQNQAYAGSGTVVYEFISATPLYGHIDIKWNGTAGGVIINDIRVYSSGTADDGAALDFARLLEEVDTCACTEQEYNNLLAIYNTLSTASRSRLANINLDDFNAGDIGGAVSGTQQNIVTASNKWAGIVAVQTGSWSGSTAPISSGMNLGNSMFANLLVILIISSISAYGYIQLKKRYIRT
jgi:hypothetical protein